MATQENTAKASEIKRLVAGELFLVPASEMEKAAREGFQSLMVRQSVTSPMPELTTRENNCLKYFALDCLVIKDIVYRMGVTDRTVRLILDAVRDKFDCITNTALVAKLYLTGWHKLL